MLSKRQYDQKKKTNLGKHLYKYTDEGLSEAWYKGNRKHASKIAEMVAKQQ